MSSAVRVNDIRDLVRASIPRPSMVDRIVSYLSPQAGVRRMQARAMLGLFGTGGYTGAHSDRPATKNWNPAAGTGDSDTLPDLPTLRNRSRDLERNDPLAASAINTYATCTIGTGVIPHSRIDREVLGLSEEAAAEWERQAERIFWAWSPHADISGRQDFAGLEDLCFRSWLASGDVFTVRRFRERQGNILGLKLQILEADRVSNPNWAPDTDDLAGGIQLDGDGQPIKCFFLNKSATPSFGFGAGTAWESLPFRGPVTGERLVLHTFHQKRPDQRRGVPLLAPIIETLKQISRYSEAELMAAVISSMFTVFIEPPVGTDPVTFNPIDSDAPAVPAKELHLGAGLIAELAAGEKVSFANPQRPNSQYDPFFQSFVKQCGAAIEMPYEVLTKAFMSSYSASKGAFLEAWRGFLTKRGLFVTSFCEPAWEWMISEAIARGYLDAPGFFEDPFIRAAWLGTEWVGPTQGDIDELDAVRAAAERMAAGLTTLDHETTKMTGGDWLQNHIQRVKEVEMRREAGLDVEPLAARTITDVVPPEDGGDPADSRRAAARHRTASMTRTQREKMQERQLNG